MSLSVKHVNADATFLLSFEPLATSTPSTPSSPSEASSGRNHGAFTILCDPWLSGPSTILHSMFSIQDHTVPACVSSLQELPEPDLVIISQAKPDHCHEKTLRQLSPRGRTLILAEPSAARRIRSWKHFDPSKVHSLKRFDENAPRGMKGEDNVYRIPILAPTPTGTPGEVTVALMMKKHDISGLHTAFGITYRPPTAWPPWWMQMDPPDSPRSFRSSFTTTTHNTTSTTYSSPSDRAQSVIFSPHGMSFDEIRPWASTHLVHEAALPLTAILHPFDRVENPWWLGGTISTGTPGGLEIAQALHARHWISTHDEEKVLGGVSVSNLRMEKYGPEDIRQLTSAWTKGSNMALNTDVRVLDVGQHLFIGPWGMDLDGYKSDQ